MRPDCMTVEELARLGELPETHARRRHAEECPRCQALLQGYREFVEAWGTVPADELAAAESRLAEFTAQEIAGGARRPSPSEVQRGPRWHVPWLDHVAAWLRAPAARPAWAVAGVFVVAGLLLLARGQAHPQRQRILLRGVPESSRPGPTEIVVQPLVSAPPGRVEVSWRAVPGADTYVLRLYSAELDSLASFGGLQENRFTLESGAVPGVPAGESVFLKVLAYRGGIRIGESRLQTLDVP